MTDRTWAEINAIEDRLARDVANSQLDYIADAAKQAAQPAISREDLIIGDYRRQVRAMEKLLRQVAHEYEDSGAISEDLVYDIEYYIRGVDGPDE